MASIEIPQYGGPQIQQAGLPGARLDQNAPLEAFGGGRSADQVTDAASGAENAIGQFVDQEKRKADQIWSMNANMQATKAKNDAIYNPQTGLMTMKGQDAFAAPEKVMGNFQDSMDAIADTANNDRQRAMLQHIKMAHMSELDTEIQKHVAGESRRFDEDSTNSAIATSMDDATLNYHDAGKVQNAIEQQRAIMTDFGQRQGWPQDLVNQKLEELTSKTHVAVIDRMLANDQDMMAKQYYEANKDQVSGHDATTLEKAIQEGSTRGEAQRQSDDIMSKGLSMSASLEKAREIEDPKLRDQTAERVRQRFTEQEASKRDAVEKNFQQAGNILDQTPDINAVMKLPMWQTFTISEKESLKNYSKQTLNKDLPAKNGEDFYNLMTMAGTPELKQEFLKTNLMEYKDKVAPEEIAELIKKQTDGRSGKDMKMDGFRSDQEIINGILSDAGVNHNAKPGTAEAKQVTLFRGKVDDEVMKYQERTGKKVTNDVLKQIGDNLMIEGQTDDGLFGSGLFAGKKRLYQIDDTTKEFKVQANSIPPTERVKIEAALKKHGFAVTDSAVLRLYKKKIGGLASGD